MPRASSWEQLICELGHPGSSGGAVSSSLPEMKLLPGRKALADRRLLPAKPQPGADGAGAARAVRACCRTAFEFLSSVTGLEICFHSALD